MSAAASLHGTRQTLSYCSLQSCLAPAVSLRKRSRSKSDSAINTGGPVAPSNADTQMGDVVRLWVSNRKRRWHDRINGWSQSQIITLLIDWFLVMSSLI